MRMPLVLATLLAASLCLGSAQANTLPIFNPPSAEQLHLSPEQAQEWAALQADAIALRRQLLAEVAQDLPALEQALAAPDADLGLLAQHVQSQVLYALWQTQPIRERRLAFYESLDPDQQAQVRSWLIGVVQRLERLIEAAQVLQAQ